MKKIVLLLLLVLIVIQFFKPAKNIAIAPSPYTIKNVPADIDKIIRTSCYDCHSNNTQYPWYNNFQPVAWWLNNHVQGGKKHLNFDNFDSVATTKKVKILKNISSTVSKNEMPLGLYTLIHRNAILTLQQKNLIVHWSDSLVKLYDSSSK